ncbi:hypothetical protein [Emticicia sp. 17c]|uniref:hypothetical protein n=1 Tax=Emticicia sp. 17c TaxID=3127704 RepID=UPI00301B8A00
MPQTFMAKRAHEKTQQQIASLEVKIGELYEIFNFLNTNNKNLIFPNKEELNNIRKGAIQEIKNKYPELNLEEIK